MENSMCRCRLFSLTFRTPSGIGLLSLAIVGISALSANKAFRPFCIRQESQALLLIRKLCFKMQGINMCKQILHAGFCFGTIFDKGR
jgi:hypothetical protein